MWLAVIPLFIGCMAKTPANDSGNDGLPPPLPTPIIVSTSSTSLNSDRSGDADQQRENTLRAVTEAIERARADFPGRSAVHFIDIESDRRLDFDGDRRFEAASLVKLVVITEVFRQIEVGQLKGDQTLTLEEKQIVGGAGDLKELEPGLTFPIKVLVEKMITQSDNTATLMLTDLIGNAALNKSTANLGLTGTTVERDIYDFDAIDRGLDNYTTARDVAHVMFQLACDKLPGSEAIHSILERQRRNDMIGSAAPEGVIVAHKTGELDGILHDVGVVYAPRGAYVLALLSDEVTDKERAVEVWSQLSHDILKVYQTKSASPPS